MIENGFEKTLEVKYSDMEHDLTLKPYALLNFLQDLASENAEMMGFGYSSMYHRNLGWFLIKYRMEFYDYPIGCYKIRLKTQSRGYNRLFAYRDFEIYDGEKLLGRVASMWSVVDLNTKTLIPIAQAFAENSAMPLFSKKEDDLAFGKIEALKNSDYHGDFKVRYNDLDVNGHTNNGNYIIWALEPLSYGFRKQHKLEVLDIVFKKEIKYGERLVSMLQFTDKHQTTHVLKNKQTEEDVCLMNCQWTNI